MSCFINEGKCAILPLFNKPEVLSSASARAKLFAKSFSKNTNFDDSGISLLVLPSRTYVKVHNISITPKVVSNYTHMKKVEHTSEFLFDIYSWTWKTTVCWKNSWSGPMKNVRIWMFTILYFFKKKKKHL